MLRGLLQSLQAGPLNVSLRQGMTAVLEPSTSTCMSAENCMNMLAKRWATKKSGGRTKNKKDSNAKHLGVKLYGGQLIFPGQIIVRQRGLKFRPGCNVGVGRDHTLFSTTVGTVSFREERFKKISTQGTRRYIDVKPLDNDYSAGYQAKVADMVERRRQLLLALRRDGTVQGVEALLPRGSLRQQQGAAHAGTSSTSSGVESTAAAS